MKFHSQQAFRALILLAFCGLLFKMHYTGEIGKYINVKYSIFTQIASVLFLFLFYIQSRRIWTDRSEDEHKEEACEHGPGCGHDHSHGDASGWTLKPLILLFPLVAGFLLPPQTLDAEAAAKKGVLQAAPSTTESRQAQQTQLDKEQQRIEQLYAGEIQELERMSRIVLDEKKFVTYADTIMNAPDKFIGKPIQLRGFVYKEEGMAPDQLVVSRFVITHCVADAGIIGFLSTLDAAPKLAQDTWIQVEGVLDVTDYADNRLPVIRISGWKKVDPPTDPYVYPELQLLVKP